MSLTNYRNILNPHIVVHADGWQTTLGELSKRGWFVEMMYEPQYMAQRFVLRNPSKYMTGSCHIEDEYVQMIQGTSQPIAYMDERVLVRAEFYQEMRVPKAEVFSVDIAEPIRPPYDLRGDDNEWMMYTPDNSNSIIVTPDKVPMLLEEIRKAQEPRAKEIIHSQMKRDSRVIKTEAKILSFG